VPVILDIQSAIDFIYEYGIGGAFAVIKEVKEGKRIKEG
jgi:hypothetical protein